MGSIIGAIKGSKSTAEVPDIYLWSPTRVAREASKFEVTTSMQELAVGWPSQVTRLVFLEHRGP